MRALPRPPGPFREGFWRSPLRGPWLASLLGSLLLPAIVICAVTGFLSHAAYDADLGRNAVIQPGEIGINPYFFHWPTSPSWLYAFTQGLHVTTGIVAIPLLLAKLWAAIPKLFEWPALRSPAHALERLSLALLVGGSLFVFATGVLNVQIYYPFKFPFVPGHYYGSFVFLGALAFHVAIKFSVVRRSFREQGVLRPLRTDLEHTEPEPEWEGEETTAPASPAAPTMSRRGLMATVGAGTFGLLALTVGQSIGGPLREVALLAPRGGKSKGGPNGFQVNKTATTAGIKPADTGASWRLDLGPESLSRAQLMAMEQHTYDLTIACVEGWSTTQTWTGVRVRDLAAAAGVPGAEQVLVESLQKSGAFRQVTLSHDQIHDERTLLALKVNGVDLSLDHGFPARLIVPAAPGVHNTKWVNSMKFVTA